jgi:hypothetical protein
LKELVDTSEKELESTIKEFSESIKLDLNDEYLNFLKNSKDKGKKRKSKIKRRSNKKSRRYKKKL